MLFRSSGPSQREVSVLHGGLSPLGMILCRLSDLQESVEHNSHLPQHLHGKSQPPRARAKRLLVKVCPKGFIAQLMAACASGWGLAKGKATARKTSAWQGL